MSDNLTSNQSTTTTTNTSSAGSGDNNDNHLQSNHSSTTPTPLNKSFDSFKHQSSGSVVSVTSYDSVSISEQSDQSEQSQGSVEFTARPNNFFMNSRPPMRSLAQSNDSDDAVDWGNFSNFFASMGIGSGGGWSSRYDRPMRDAKEMWAEEEKLSLADRRKRYRCRQQVTIDKFIPWPQYAQSKLSIAPDAKSIFKHNDDINRKVCLYNGDITQLEIDCIVNAANESCLGGGGVDGAIHRAAGNDLYEECRTLRGCPTGQSKITRGYYLPAQYVIHSVGPMDEDPDMLASCYSSVLDLVKQHKIKSIAFCGISTGIFGFPLQPATRIALRIVREWLEVPENRASVDLIIFCTYLQREERCYEELMPLYFPLSDRSTLVASSDIPINRRITLMSSTSSLSDD